MWEEKLKIYDQLIDLIPDIDRKGKTMPYTSANGYMFSQLNKDGQIGIRLPKKSYTAFMEEFQTTEFRSYGAVMKEYVLVPEILYKDLNRLASYLQESYEYVCLLPPKK